MSLGWKNLPEKDQRPWFRLSPPPSNLRAVQASLSRLIGSAGWLELVALETGVESGTWVWLELVCLSGLVGIAETRAKRQTKNRGTWKKVPHEVIKPTDTQSGRSRRPLCHQAIQTWRRSLWSSRVENMEKVLLGNDESKIQQQLN